VLSRRVPWRRGKGYRFVLVADCDVSRLFEELDFQATALGGLSLRRRRDLRLGQDVFEIKLGEEYLMSSAFTASERALANLAIASLADCRRKLDVVVGGLGLGYTAQAVLAYETVGSLMVIDALQPVIDWHRKGLLPVGTAVSEDHRCELVHADFFVLAASQGGIDAASPGRQFDAVLVDIDHSPDALLHPGNADFYNEAGLASAARHLKPGGVFGLWSNDTPDEAFSARLQRVFATARHEKVVFHNPLQNRAFTQTVYLAWVDGCRGDLP